MKSLIAPAFAVALAFGSASDVAAQLVANPVFFNAPVNGSSYSYNANLTDHNTVPLDAELLLYNPPFIPNYMQVFLYEYIWVTGQSITASHFNQGTLIPLTSTTIDAQGNTLFHYQTTFNLPGAINGSGFYFDVSFYDSVGNRYATRPDDGAVIFQPSGQFSLNSYILRGMTSISGGAASKVVNPGASQSKVAADTSKRVKIRNRPK